MSLFKFTRVPKHQQFEYKPRYWNPEKEELDNRLRRTEAANSDDPEAIKARIISGFRSKGYGYGKQQMSFRSRETKRSNRTLFIILAVLALISYIFIKTVLPEWASHFK